MIVTVVVHSNPKNTDPTQIPVPAGKTVFYCYTHDAAHGTQVTWVEAISGMVPLLIASAEIPGACGWPAQKLSTSIRLAHESTMCPIIIMNPTISCVAGQSSPMRFPTRKGKQIGIVRIQVNDDLYGLYSLTFDEMRPCQVHQ